MVPHRCTDSAADERPSYKTVRTPLAKASLGNIYIYIYGYVFLVAVHDPGPPRNGDPGSRLGRPGQSALLQRSVGEGPGDTA